jgi:hypothetical protein
VDTCGGRLASLLDGSVRRRQAIIGDQDPGSKTEVEVYHDAATESVLLRCEASGRDHGRAVFVLTDQLRLP